MGDLKVLLCCFRLMQCLAGSIRTSFPLKPQRMSGSPSSIPKSILITPIASDLVCGNAVHYMICFHDNMLHMSGGKPLTFTLTHFHLNNYY